VTRRDLSGASLRARAAHLDPAMVLGAWDETAAVGYDRAIWSELVSLRFVGAAQNALVLGPVGVGKTFLSTALGHIACRRRVGVHFERADRLHRRLEACRLNGTYEAKMRKTTSSTSLLQPPTRMTEGRSLRCTGIPTCASRRRC
jgi:DNA replication protein DnaC